MLKRQQERIDAYLRVQRFLDDHPPPDSAPYARQKKRFDHVVSRLMEHASEQSIGRRQRQAAIARREALVRALREEHLMGIARVARHELADAPGIDKTLHMPDYYLPPFTLLMEAKAMRDAAELYEERFIRSGLPEDFLEQLDHAIVALQQSVQDTARQLGRQVGGTAGLEADIRRGRQLVETLHTIVNNAFRGDAELLSQWRIARRVRSAEGRGRRTESGGGEA